MLKYIENIHDLVKEREARMENREEIAAKLRNYWSRRGVPWEDLKKMVGTGAPAPPLLLELVLSRQVPTVNMESLLFVCFSKVFGQKTGLEAKPVCWYLSSDKFFKRNDFKRSLVELKILESGGMRKLEIGNGRNIEGAPLYSVHVREGKSLIEWHGEMRKKILPPELDNTVDMTGVYARALAGALARGDGAELERIGSVYLDKDGQSEKLSWDHRESFVNRSKGLSLKLPELVKLTQEEKVRPLAGWYYQIFLSFFLTGERVLCENFDGVRDFMPVLNASLKVLKEEAGIKCDPLILKSPAVEVRNGKIASEYLLEEYPPWAFAEAPDFSWIKKALKSANHNGSGELEPIFQELAENILGLN